MAHMATSCQFILVGDVSSDRWHRVLREALLPLGCLQISSERQMVALLKEQAYAVAIVDAGAVGNASEVVSDILALVPGIRVVVVTASPHWKIARAVFRAGAADYLYKSLDKDEILASFRAVLG